MKKKFEKRTIKLPNGAFEEYFINPKQKTIAMTRKLDRKIYVNNDFENLSKKKKDTIILHERGHSNFWLWRISLELGGILLSLAFIFIFFSLFFITFNLTLKIKIFGFGNLLWIMFILIGLINFLGFVLINWLLEIIADLNSIKNIRKQFVIKTIGEFYENKKFNLWNDLILHPPWKLRKRLMNEFD